MKTSSNPQKVLLRTKKMVLVLIDEKTRVEHKLTKYTILKLRAGKVTGCLDTNDNLDEITEKFHQFREGNILTANV